MSRISLWRPSLLSLIILALVLACGLLLSAESGYLSLPAGHEASAQDDGGVVEEWVSRYEWGSTAAAIAVDAAGNVYVTGESLKYASRAGSDSDYATIKYGPDGSEQWIRVYNGPGNSDHSGDQATALAVDAAGNVYVTGSSVGPGTDYDYATIKYGPDGSERWISRYNASNNFSDQAVAIAVDAAGNVYVTGSSGGSGGSSDYATVKYGPDGSEQWISRYNGPGNSTDEAVAIAVDAAGNIYVTGTSSFGSTFYPSYATIKYGPDGSERWVQRYDGPGTGAAIAVDAAGNVYVVGSSYGPGGDLDYATVKYGPDGSEQWVSRYDGPGNHNDYATAIAVEATGNVYVTGGSSNGDWDFNDYTTIKYGPDGSEQWVRRYNGPGGVDDRASAIALDVAGNIYVTGSSAGFSGESDYATVKYGPDGSEQWVQRYNGPGNNNNDNRDDATDIAVDAAGNVYVTGSSVGSTDRDYVTVKYSPIGENVLLPLTGIASESGASADGSNWLAGVYAALVGAGAVTCVCGWYARRRWLS